MTTPHRDRINDRTLRYAGRVFDRRVVITVDPAYILTYHGQVVLLVLVSLIARMTSRIGLRVQSTIVVSPLPWAGQELNELLIQSIKDVDPDTDITSHEAGDDDFLVIVGPQGPGLTVWGDAWTAYVGTAPLTNDESPYPAGAAMAAVLAAGTIFGTVFGRMPVPLILNTHSWEFDSTAKPFIPQKPMDGLGNLWVVGTGSVGTAVLYFLTLLTRRMTVSLFDHDKVKVENIDRSPLFGCPNLPLNKATVTAEYLRSLGVTDVMAYDTDLQSSGRYEHRAIGTPDLLISSANEKNIRSHIEAHYPPLQIYGTTGRNWQASMIRHRPPSDACALCLFGEEEIHATTQCATGHAVSARGEQVDASLPYLSYAAGFMAGIEIMKLSLGIDPVPGVNQVVLNSTPFTTTRLFREPTDGCICRSRDKVLYQEISAGGQYSA